MVMVQQRKEENAEAKNRLFRLLMPFFLFTSLFENKIETEINERTKAKEKTFFSSSVAVLNEEKKKMQTFISNTLNYVNNQPFIFTAH